jgi:membrane-bound lytic murein transglycosylase
MLSPDAKHVRIGRIESDRFVRQSKQIRQKASRLRDDRQFRRRNLNQFDCLTIRVKDKKFRKYSANFEVQIERRFAVSNGGRRVFGGYVSPKMAAKTGRNVRLINGFAVHRFQVEK